MTIGGEAPKALALMWSFVTVTWILNLFMPFARIFIEERRPSSADYVCSLSNVFLLLFAVLFHIAAGHGFGQSMPSLKASEASLAVKIGMIGQTFAILGMAIAKTCLGLFLLSILKGTELKWAKRLISTAFCSLLIDSIVTTIIFWVQCRPVTKIFDIRVEGTCDINVTPFAIALGVWCIVVDFLFALMPWFLFHNLVMEARDKIQLCSIMSIGVLAGICGIFRTLAVATGFTANYTLDTVPLIVWSAAEMAITLICYQVMSLCRSWRMVRGRLRKDSTSHHDSANAEGNSIDVHRMDGIPRGDKVARRTYESLRHGCNEGFTQQLTRVWCPDNDTDSTTGILGPDGRELATPVNSRICVKREVMFALLE
ncbi:hypothetical protein FHETE_1366 [Fusarium heterosporum]|uniref:Rhodopsin domain-containing protein n=1 Tax=Fusarium heterosporum TaxID=42747 RepID=A0A8H5WZT9_FUSHE|nr:hypothetical protein FHETE_1366 [Fusarium heterosporum]